VAILFVIFDVETTFPVSLGCVVFHSGRGFPPAGLCLASMFVFLGILIIGYVWLYRKGALEWV
jgi:NADH-quinone oxidoreductase subunit A